MTDKLDGRRRNSSRNALLVGAGILLSRLVGLVRERVFAHYFGNTDSADAFKAALRIPNLLQNLFGEGALSSSFIPVYAKLLASGEKEEANRVSRVVGSVLSIVTSALVLLGILATPILIDLIAPGFEGTKREFTVRMVRILFPGTGILVLSAWCLGILNSHRRFFLSYAAPVLWNATMIIVMIASGQEQDLYPLAVLVAWAAVGGSLLQFAVQIPTVIHLAGRFRFQIETVSSNVRTVIRNFIPGIASRGVNQFSSYVDSILASFLPTGAIAALAYAQTLYLLPVSLFGMSISNAELPEMSSQAGSPADIAAALRIRINAALQRVAFFIVPSAAAFLVLGDSIVALLFQTGKFMRDDVQYVWAVLAGATVGLVGATLGRLYTSAFWSLGDTRTPLRFAMIRVGLAAGSGWLLAFPLTGWLGVPARWGLVGLTLASGMGAWTEFSLLQRSLNRKIGTTGLSTHYLICLWGAAAIASILGFGIKMWTQPWNALLSGSLVLAVYGFAFLASALALRLPDALRLYQLLRRNSSIGS
jgi:putative peptidoglycan lipid II flippase